GAAGRRFRQEAPEVANERLPRLCRALEGVVGVPQDAQLVRRQVPFGEDRRLGIATLAVRHGMQRHLWRWLQHHECAAAVADLAAAVLDRHAAAADAAIALADEAMAARRRADDAGARGRGKLE